jgi:hypothetical protein
MHAAPDDGMDRVPMPLARFVPLVVALIFLSTSATAGPSEGGYSSDNVEYVGFVPFEIGTATGAARFDEFLVVTSWRSFSIYDISDPVAPELITTVPFGFKFENEDVATNGEIMLFSEEAPGNALHVWNVEDKSNPVEVATVEGAGNHTATCLDRCGYSYGSDGAIVDLRDPATAKLVGNWHKKLGIKERIHDVDEFRPGAAVVSAFEGPMRLVDVRRPLQPRLIAAAAPPELRAEAFKAGANVHATRWPRDGEDRFLMGQGGSNLAQAQCDDETRNFWSFDASGWESAGVLKLVDEYNPGSGAPNDGRYPVSTCSTHWFEPHPDFHDGGLVVIGYYDLGTRFLRIKDTGKIQEVGWFLPYAGATSSTYWITDDVVYAIDYSRGFDILRFKANR